MRDSRRRVLAIVLLIGAFGLTVFLGVLSGSQKAPSRSTSALLVVLAGILQIASASQFNAIGRADPALARATVRRLLRMGTRTHQARLLAEECFETSSPNAQELRRTMGILSVELSWVEEGLAEA